MGATVVIADMSEERGKVLAIQSSSPLVPEKKASTIIVTEQTDTPQHALNVVG